MAALLATAAPGCVCASAADVMAVGYRQPEQAFRSFQTALAADLPDLEYRTFSSRFRRDHQLSQLTYREARDQLLASKPWLVYFAKAKIVESTALSPSRHRLRVEVLGRTLQVELVREDFYEVWGADGLLFDDAADFEETVRLESAGQAGGRLIATVPTPPHLDPTTIVEIRAGREWKIDDLRELDPQDLPDVSP